MANIKISTTTLESQSQRLLALANELDDIYKNTKSAIKIVDSSMSAKFSPNMEKKTQGLGQKILDVKNQVRIAGLIAHKCSTEYQNADKTIRKYVLGLSDKTISSLPSSQAVCNQEKLNNMQGQKQQRNSKGEGLCTSAALTTLINRRFIVDGKDTTIEFWNDIRKDYLNNGGFKWENKPTDKIPYATESVTKSEILKNYKSIEDYIKNMLDNHPEGIEIYSDYGSNNHAIVISRYEIKEDGSIQFYAYDPSSSTMSETKLEDTWLCNKKFNRNVDKLFDNLIRVLYIP